LSWKAINGFFALLVLALRFGCTGYRPVSFYEESIQRASGPDFSFHVYNCLRNGKPRSDFYLAISNRVLQFTRQADKFVASYSIVVRISPSQERADSRATVEKGWTETVTEKTYDATTARAFHVSPRSFSLEPGKYSVVAEVMDEASKRSIERSATFEVPDYGASFLSVSDISVGSRFVQQEGEEKLIPDIIPEMSTTLDLHYASFEVYDQLPGREMKLDYKIYQVNRLEPLLFLSPYQRSETARKLSDTLLWVAESTLAVSSPVNPVRVPLPYLGPGHYRFDLTVRPKVPVMAAIQREVQIGQLFSVWPAGFPDIVTLEEQINVLAHIATPEEYERLLGAKTKEEKQMRLREFWAGHWNQEEYYKRAEYANRYFSCLAEGWNTAFGWAYIVLGPPDDIQLSPRGTEGWRYTLGSNRTLVIPFVVREFAFGDRKCKSAVAYLDPGLRRELILRWRKPE